MPFEVFPYTNFHELNLDTIIKYVTYIKNKTDDIDAAVSDAEAAANNAESAEARAVVAANRADKALEDMGTIANNLYNDVDALTDDLRNQVQTNKTNIEINTADIAANSARIDTFTNLAEGSTTGDAELIDARIGWNGETYNSAGDAIREQVEDLEIPMNSFNLFNSVDLLDDALIGSDGTPTSTPNWKGVFYVPTRSATHIALIGYFTRITVGLQNNIACYDENKQLLGGCFQATNGTYYQQTVALLPDTAYVSICTATSTYGQGQMYLYPMVDYLANFDTDLIDAMKEVRQLNIAPYDFTGNYWKSDENGGFEAPSKNRLIYLKPMTNNANLTGLIVYGMYGAALGDGYDTLMSVRYGSIGTAVTQRSYHHIQVSSLPYTPTANYTFEYGETDYVDSLLSLYNNPVEKIPAIFRKVVCCGDSYTCATIFDSDGNIRATNEEYAWPKFISNYTGRNWVNCGASGTTVLTWQTHVRGLLKAQASGRSQAYIIGLGINDGRAGDQHVPVGTSADIGTSAQTYYGGMSQIVDALFDISPTAHIFINTNPVLAFTGTDYSAYNTAVRDIVAYYQLNGKRVHLIDCDELKELFNTPAAVTDVFHQHPTAAGYEMIAETYLKVLSNYMMMHINNFKDVFTIPFD